MPTRLSRDLRRAILLPHAPERSDAELVKGFWQGRDEAAFETLLRRHGRMVLGVCRRLLGNTPDSDDAFQATFLVFVRKAASLRAPEAVGSWLYGVAYRTALEARVRRARQRAKEQKVLDMPQPQAATDNAWQELLPYLDRELARLPDKYRLPVVLCELEGRSRKDVARQLKIPEGTLSSRLASARKLLARRLAGYGVTLSRGTLAAVRAPNGASAEVPPALLISTLHAATGQTAVLSARVAALAEGTVKAMFLAKLRLVSGAVVMLAMLGAGAGAYSALRAEGQEKAPAQHADRAKTLEELDRQVDRLALKAATVQTAAHGIRKAIDDLRNRTHDRQTEMEALEDIERLVEDLKAILERDKQEGGAEKPAPGGGSANSGLPARVQRVQWLLEEVDPARSTISIRECIPVVHGGFGTGGMGFSGGGLAGFSGGQLGGGLGQLGLGGLGMNGSGFGGLGSGQLGFGGGQLGQFGNLGGQFGSSPGQGGFSGGTGGALSGNIAGSDGLTGSFSLPLRLVDIPVAANATIIINRKRAALGELKSGMRVSLRLARDHRAISRILASSSQLDYVLESVDLPGHTLSIRLRTPMVLPGEVLDRLPDVPVAGDAEVLIDKKEGRFADLKKGMSIALDLTVQGNQVVVKRIRAEKK
jgi:RNA polymerase sigma factor (sigma-70 family)